MIMLSFKGNRNYIHSSDIISLLEKKFPNLTNLKVTFKSPIFGQPIFKFSKKDKFKNDNFFGQFCLDNEICYFSFLDTLDKNLKKYPYDEHYLFQKFKILRNNSVEFFEESKHTNIDLFISMCKYFSINKFKSKKWSVIKVNLNQSINNLQCKNRKISLSICKSHYKRIS